MSIIQIFEILIFTVFHDFSYEKSWGKKLQYHNNDFVSYGNIIDTHKVCFYSKLADLILFFCHYTYHRADGTVVRQRTKNKNTFLNLLLISASVIIDLN